nr:DNA polymerase [Lentinula edodes]UZS78144.1 DNA polymerase [Lentinula edodes]
MDYCVMDCISLYEILIKFNNLIFDKFNININNKPTLPSLSFSNFRYNYLEKDQIAQISGKIKNDIKISYTGGTTDMYIPFNEENINLYVYVVNSLYPFVMKEFEYPIGTPTYFEGNIRNINKDAFGIFFCEIESPKYLEHPIIQTHVKNKNGIRTMSPLGNWFDWICSPEMDNAMKYRYKFKIIKSYTFNKGRPFKNIIDDLYKLRLEYPKSDPMNYIAKLFMNSLYGRFGMNDNFNEIRIVNDNSLNDLINNKTLSIQDIYNLDKDFYCSN